jgi:putative oxidoreductase
MKIATVISRSLMGLLLVVMGANKFLNFMPIPPMEGAGAQFLGAMFETHYIYVVAACEVIGGLLLLTGRFAPLGLTLVGPVIVNILAFHIFMDNSGLPVAFVLSALGLFLLLSYREHFAALVKPVKAIRGDKRSAATKGAAITADSAKN